MSIKFVEYKFERELCNGILTLEIDGKTCIFGDGQQYEKFWIGGRGCFYLDENKEVHRSKTWEFDLSKLPEEFQEISVKLTQIFNKNISTRLCKGCI